ncbi:MAG: hypothetical protein JKY46_02350 [Robiginitomaculum sp.]|nr:hypothetical protein [Robiginitomaculum sp.]
MDDLTLTLRAEIRLLPRASLPVGKEFIGIGNGFRSSLFIPRNALENGYPTEISDCELLITPEEKGEVTLTMMDTDDPRFKSSVKVGDAFELRAGLHAIALGLVLSIENPN